MSADGATDKFILISTAEDVALVIMGEGSDSGKCLPICFCSEIVIVI